MLNATVLLLSLATPSPVDNGFVQFPGCTTPPLVTLPANVFIDGWMDESLYSDLLQAVAWWEDRGNIATVNPLMPQDGHDIYILQTATPGHPSIVYFQNGCLIQGVVMFVPAGEALPYYVHWLGDAIGLAHDDFVQSSIMSWDLLRPDAFTTLPRMGLIDTDYYRLMDAIVL